MEKRVPWKKPAAFAACAALLAITMDLLWFGLKFPSGRAVSRAGDIGRSRAPAIVLGAGIIGNREPTQVLEDRLETARLLYAEKKVPWILVSGDNRTAGWNEPEVMRRWLVRNGVPNDCIACDFAGRTTFETLYRAKHIWGLDEALLVTSDFHMPRTLYLARHIGLEARGVPSSTAHYGPIKYRWRLRDYLASHKAVWHTRFPPPVIMGEKEPRPKCPPEPPLAEDTGRIEPKAPGGGVL